MSRKPKTAEASAPAATGATQAQIKAFQDLGQSAGSWLILPDGAVLPADEATAFRLAAWLEAVKSAEATTVEESAS